MADEPTAWKLLRFEEVVDSWVQRESPPVELRMAVLSWALGQRDDPYRGMRRDRNIPNLWFGQVDGTEHNDAVATCTYWIFERTRIVRCDMISTLTLPIWPGDEPAPPG